jgi:molybdopterin synthase catalytic subunit
MAAIIKVTQDPLDDATRQALIEEVCRPSDGGIVTFLGVVRDSSRGKQIRYLEYDAYIEMAEQEMSAIAAEVTLRWATDHVAMVHRIGRL